MHSPLNMLVPSFHSLIDLSISSETPRKYIIWAIGQAWFLWMKKGITLWKWLDRNFVEHHTFKERNTPPLSDG
jgi:hypothetical protein